MANFNVTLLVSTGKNASAVWSYSGSLGLSSGNPIDVQIGDTVTFIRHASSGGDANVKLLNIFTSNADIVLTTSLTSVARTVASGGTTLDTISGLNQGEGNTDSLYIERQAAAGDTTIPVITLVGSASVSLNVGGTYSDAGATATDNIDGTITSSIVTVNPVDVNTAGTYTVTYNVDDAAGNSATQVTRSVTVTAYVLPDVTITDVTDVTRPNGSTNHSITIATGSSITIYEVKTGSASGTVVGTRTGNGAITVASIPSAGTSATYYITGRVTTANGGNNTASLADTYIVVHEAAAGSGTGDGGTGTYGLRVYDASGNTTLDLSDRVVTFRERVQGSLSASETTKTVTLSGVGTAVINLTPITVIFVGNIPQRQKILYFTISGTSLTITRTAVNAAGSSAATQSYDLLVVYDPVA